MFGSLTKRIFCCQDMSIAKIMFTGIQHLRRKSYTQLHPVKCTAWVAISKHSIIGPYWFEDENERGQTVNKERYVAVLRKFWASLGRRRGTDRDDQWFQQDGVTPPTHTHTHQIILLTGWESDFRKGWSAGSVTSSGYLIHRTWTLWFLSVGISEGPCVSEQSSNNWWAQGYNCSKNQGNPQKGVHASDWQFLRNGC